MSIWWSHNKQPAVSLRSLFFFGLFFLFFFSSLFFFYSPRKLSVLKNQTFHHLPQPSMSIFTAPNRSQSAQMAATEKTRKRPSRFRLPYPLWISFPSCPAADRLSFTCFVCMRDGRLTYPTLTRPGFAWRYGGLIATEKAWFATLDGQLHFLSFLGSFGGFFGVRLGFLPIPSIFSSPKLCPSIVPGVWHFHVSYCD